MHIVANTSCLLQPSSVLLQFATDCAMLSYVYTCTAINQEDFISWCMLYMYKGNKCIREKMTMYFRVG